MHQNLFSVGRVSVPDPTGGAYDAPQTHWGGRYPPHFPPPQRLRRLEFSAYGAFTLRPPQHKFLAMSVIPTNESLCPTFPPLVVWVYLHSNFSDGLRKAGA